MHRNQQAQDSYKVHTLGFIVFEQDVHDPPEKKVKLVPSCDSQSGNKRRERGEQRVKWLRKSES